MTKFTVFMLIGGAVYIVMKFIWGAYEWHSFDAGWWQGFVFAYIGNSVSRLMFDAQK